MKYSYFSIQELFPKIKNLQKYPSIPESDGMNAFVSSSALNNGVVSFVTESSFSGRCITVSTNGNCFDCFYHEGSIAISTDVEILTNDHLNEYNALYICTILKKETFKWCYGRKPKNDKVYKTLIKLPVDDNNNPDWLYMEKFIKDFYVKNHSYGCLNDCLSTKNSHNKVLTCKSIFHRTHYFKFSSLFKNTEECIYKAKAYAKIDLDVSEKPIDGYIPFVSRTENNNGIDCYAKYEDGMLIEEGNCLIIGDTTATIFYQNKSFVAGDHILVLRSDWLNKYTGLFIKTLLDKERYRYSYGRAYKRDFVLNTIIPLPVDDYGQPDWKIIEEYIKNSPFSDRI